MTQSPEVTAERRWAAALLHNLSYEQEVAAAILRATLSAPKHFILVSLQSGLIKRCETKTN